MLGIREIARLNRLSAATVSEKIRRWADRGLLVVVRDERGRIISADPESFARLSVAGLPKAPPRPVELSCCSCGGSFLWVRVGTRPRRCEVCRNSDVHRRPPICSDCSTPVSARAKRCSDCQSAHRRLRSAQHWAARPPQHRTCRDCSSLVDKHKQVCDPCRSRSVGQRSKALWAKKIAASGKVRRCDCPPKLRDFRLEHKARVERAGRAYMPMVERARLAAEKRRAAVRARQDKAAAREVRHSERPWLRPGLSSAEVYRLRYSLDPEFNLSERLRAQVRDRRKVKRFEDGIRSALKGKSSGRALADFLGYEIAALRQHFERLFDPGMTWEAFSRGEIHIGHRLPLASFDLSSEVEIRAAWALPNLQPEWAGDNIRRGAKREWLI